MLLPPPKSLLSASDFYGACDLFSTCEVFWPTNVRCVYAYIVRTVAGIGILLLVLAAMVLRSALGWVDDLICMAWLVAEGTETPNERSVVRTATMACQLFALLLAFALLWLAGQRLCAESKIRAELQWEMKCIGEGVSR